MSAATAWDILGRVADAVGIAGAFISVLVWLQTRRLEVRIEARFRGPKLVAELTLASERLRSAVAQDDRDLAFKELGFIKNAIQKLLELGLLARKRKADLVEIERCYRLRQVDPLSSITLRVHDVLDEMKVRHGGNE